MRPVVVLAEVSDQSINEIRQIYYDWSLSGLVQPLVWLDIRTGGRHVTAMLDGELVRITLAHWLDRLLPSDGELQIISLQIAGTGTKYFLDTDIREALKEHPMLVHAETTMLNLIAPNSDASEVPRSALLQYRTNIVVIPVQGAFSHSGYKNILPNSSEFFANVAASLASAAGAWAGMDTPGVLEIPTSKQRNPEVVLLRTFCRYADASGLVDGIIQEIVTEAASGVLPAAFDESGERLTPNPEASSLQNATAVAQAFVAANRGLLAFAEPKKRPVQEASSLKPSDLFRQFFSYLLRYFSLRSWLNSKIYNSKQKIASSLQKIFLGDSSAREVFVLGVSADTPRNEDSTLNAIEALLQASNAVTRSVAEPSSNSPNFLWQDYVDILTGLADGSRGPTSVDLPNVIGGDRRIILNPNHLAPHPNFRNFRVPEDLPIRLRGEVVRANDPYLALLLEDQLNSVLSDPKKYSPVEIALVQRTQFDFAQWMKDADSFSWQIGRSLSAEINKARKILGEIPSLIDLSKGNQIKLVELEAKAQNALGRVVVGAASIISGGLILWLAQAVTIFLLFGAWPLAIVSGWLLPVAIVAGLSLAWVALGLRPFAGAVRDIFKFENEARHAGKLADWIEAIKPDLRASIARLADLYKQLAIWNELVIPILYSPLGSPQVDPNTQSPIKNVNRLTNSIQLAELRYETPLRDELLTKVRASFYKRGWLSAIALWRLEQLGANFPKSWSDTAQEDKSDLRKMSQALMRKNLQLELGARSQMQIQKIARGGANYAQWPLEIMNASKDQTCYEYFEILGTGKQILPDDLLTPSASVRGMGKADFAHSFVLQDPRVGFKTDASVIHTNESAVAKYHRLDLINVRVEVTKPMPFTDVIIFDQTPVIQESFDEVSLSPEG
jgi:hypothetical protein